MCVHQCLCSLILVLQQSACIMPTLPHVLSVVCIQWPVIVIVWPILKCQYVFLCITFKLAEQSFTVTQSLCRHNGL